MSETIKGYTVTLEEGCSYETYRVEKDDHYVTTLKYHEGSFWCDYRGDEIYRSNDVGDGYFSFNNTRVRRLHILKAIKALYEIQQGEMSELDELEAWARD